MRDLDRLSAILNERFEGYVHSLDRSVPCHRVEFSRRILSSWALIYYQRRLVRLSPYLFLLPPEALKRGSHWNELDATLRHEAAHAVTFARTGETGHSPLFHELLDALGVQTNGSCDLGPENATHQYVYACPSCEGTWSRRVALRGNWSCGSCAPGRFAAEHRVVLAQRLPPPYARLASRRDFVAAAVEEALMSAPKAVAL